LNICPKFSRGFFIPETDAEGAAEAIAIV